jgi:hypothetical protein
MANDNVRLGFDVETKAVFVKTTSGGKTYYRRCPFNIEVRTDNATGKRSTYMALALGGGHTPGRANTWDKDQGEVYDAVLYFDTYPSEWPRIGEMS